MLLLRNPIFAVYRQKGVSKRVSATLEKYCLSLRHSEIGNSWLELMILGCEAHAAKEATKMRGRSKVTFKQVERRLLQGAEQEATEEKLTFFNAVSKAFDLHTQQGNWLINVERRIMANTKIKQDQAKVRSNNAYNRATL